MTHEVFGLSHTVLEGSYVDRGDLDEQIHDLLNRPGHIALRGVSKSGKSWLRQSAIPDALVVQCRLGRTVLDLYVDALSQLGIRLEVETSSADTLSGKLHADLEVGIKLLAKARVGTDVEGVTENEVRSAAVGHDIHDLRFLAEILLASGRRLVVEDFHYLSTEQRKGFAFDLKALWDYGCFVTIIGVWSEQNMLLYLNPDLTGRVTEVPIVWRPDDLRQIFRRGGDALNVSFGDDLIEAAVSDCHENAGILQALIMLTLDRLGIKQSNETTQVADDVSALEHACLTYADQLTPMYMEFAKRVARGIRTRADSTGIYAHSMAVIMEASDTELIRGLPVDAIYATAHARQGRIQKGNLKTVLEKFESLQVDDDGRGLVLAYNPAAEEVAVVDRQLLLYRKYSTVRWPWEELVREAEAQDPNTGESS